MTIEDIYNIIVEDTGIDLKENHKKTAVADLKKMFYALCYAYADEYVVDYRLIEYTKNKSHATVNLALKDIETCVKYNKIFSIQYERLDKLIASKTPKKQRYNGSVDSDYLHLFNDNKRLRKSNIKLTNSKNNSEKKFKYYKKRYSKINYQLKKLKEKVSRNEELMQNN